MPMSADFQARLNPHLHTIAKEFGTPFHIYDEVGIREACRRLNETFRSRGFPDYRNYYAVKALPNPEICRIVYEEGMGFDCSSIPEIEIAVQFSRNTGDIMFTSNNTTQEEYRIALAEKDSCILNLDDAGFVAKVPGQFPELICFRYNPGKRVTTEGGIIGNPYESKYGVPHEQIVDAYRQAIARGAKRFGLHTMLASNTLNEEFIIDTARILLAVAKMIGKELGIRFEFINIGGGFGTPYWPVEKELDLDKIGDGVAQAFEWFEKAEGYRPNLFTECGRYVTGPSGILVTRVINLMHKYLDFAGVDACSSSLMRPLMYGAYHHITVVGKEDAPMDKEISVCGSICEGIDRFTPEPRFLAKIELDNLIAIHNTGAHAIAMAFQYNARLRPPELIRTAAGVVYQIRRAETQEDYFATLHNLNPKSLKL